MTRWTAKERKAKLAMEPHGLYRVFSANGNLLYIGASCHPVIRLYSHAKMKAWATDIHHITVEWYPSRADALNAETKAIQTENPKWNHVHNPTRPQEVGRFIQGFRHDDRTTWEYDVSGGGISADDLVQHEP